MSPLRRFPLLAIVFLLVDGALGYTTFTPNCSILEQPANFVESPHSRGTLDILWSCLFTIIACTWTILHLNVPEQRADESSEWRGWRRDLGWTLEGTWTKMKWMITTMLAPELLISIAMGNLAHAKDEQRRLKHFIEQDGVPWSLTHSMFVDMGGFVLRGVRNETGTTRRSDTPSREISVLRERPPGVSSTLRPENVHAVEVEDIDRTSLSINLEEVNAATSTTRTEEGEISAKMLQMSISQTSIPNGTILDGPLTLAQAQAQANEDGAAQRSAPEHDTSWMSNGWRYHNPLYPFHLTASQLYMLRSEGYLQKLPVITEDEINARSKNDSFSKAIAMVQIFWNAFQVIVRAIRGLAISQLELAVTAFSACGVLIYACSWSKPKDVQVPITIKNFDNAIPISVLKRLDAILDSDEILEFATKFSLRNRAHSSGARIPNDICWVQVVDTDSRHLKPSPGEMGNHLGLLLGGVLFGSVHILAWNFSFPSEIERNIWRATSVYSCATPLLLYLFSLMDVFYNVYLNEESQNTHFSLRFRRQLGNLITPEWVEFILVGLLKVLLLLYLLARLYILVEIFRTLCFLPIDAYTSTWASNIPHVA
ncbi:hypothetical protein EG329_002877 [Mollisiaceae sp. DMI_Dod_QoI]|nr:hypothetical protein EG329_002877 [Helotiales sp. DMI_Dod_QoI]